MVPFESPSRVERRAAKISRRAANPELIVFVIRSDAGCPHIVRSEVKLDVAFPTCRRGTRAREQCARSARPVRASGGGRLDRVPRAREHGAHVRQAPPARRADGTAPQPCRAPRAPCVVVLINQVTTRANEVLGTSGLAPALGEAWAHMCNVQVEPRMVRRRPPRRPLRRSRARGGAVCCHRRWHPICRSEHKAAAAAPAC